MKSYSVAVLAKAMGGEIRQADATWLVSGGVSTDTRSIPDGALFFALRGENFDAHDFLEKAGAAGAAALVVDREVDFPTGVAIFLVDDVLIALQKLAAWYRGELGIKVVAITGSNGKTSTKDLTRAVLEQKFKVNATKGNLNNHIGLPLTVLATEETDEVLILEMGMNHAGELAPLCEIAQPDLGIITSVGTAHIEHLGSREAIAKEKGTLARCLDKNGTLLVPHDCDFTLVFKNETKAHILTVGSCGNGEIRAEKIVFDETGCVFDLFIDDLGMAQTHLPVSGRHMVDNALLAAGAGFVLGMSLDEIVTGLASLKLTSGRLRRFSSKGVTVLDDTYNANPDSVLAAIETLAELPAENGTRKFIVLGYMAELGEYAELEHARVGKKAAECALQVVVVGQKARGIFDAAGEGAKFFEEKPTAAEWLANAVKEGDVILFKGSRAAAMEDVLKQIFPES